MRRLGRKGGWTQLFMIAFFFLLLLIALILMLVQKERMVYEREQFDDDLAYELTRTALLNLLRTPIDVDLNGDETMEKVMLADAIVRGMTQEELKTELEKRLSDYAPYLMRITYPDREIVVDHVKTSNLMQRIAAITKGGTLDQQVERLAPRVHLTLQNDIQIEFLYADRGILATLYDKAPTATREKILDAITEETAAEAGE